MAKQPKYRFDPHNLTYEEEQRNWGKIALRVFGFLCASVVFAALIIWGAYSYFESPYEKTLEKKIENYQLQLSLYDKSIDELNNTLNGLIERDTQIYRIVFEAEPFEDSTTTPKNFLEKYKNLKGFDDEKEVERLNNKLFRLASNMKRQEKSFDDIIERAKRKQDMFASIPAIQPIENKDLTRVASGFGYRIHPIYKTRKMHSGMDFTAPKGTPIYSTGNGRVTFAGYNEGYGYHVVVNHGYGYETLYAHMSKMEVRKGEEVTRGQLLGKVGSTGLSTAPHLHYEVIKGDRKVNPVHFYYNDLTPEDYEKIKELAASNNQSFD